MKPLSKFDELILNADTADFSALCAGVGLSHSGEDVDECAALPGLCAPNGRCVNAHGSYRCVCDRGFAPTDGGRGCADVDECRRSRSPPCQHGCRNTVGSYVCTCPDGYALGGDGRTCRDVDECAGDGGAGRCEHECVNTPGSYECACPVGFNKMGDRCIDADECVEQPVRDRQTSCIESTQ